MPPRLPRLLAALEHCSDLQHLRAPSAKCGVGDRPWSAHRGRHAVVPWPGFTAGGTARISSLAQVRYVGNIALSLPPPHLRSAGRCHVYSLVLYSVATHAHTPCMRTAGRRPCSPLLSRVHILVHTAVPPIADAYSCGYSCLHSCLLCSCLMVWSGTAVMAYDGAGTAGSKRQRKAAPRFVFDEYCRTVWRASEKFCLV